ncbi:hypothetical protein ACQCT5_06540 [Sutcliffiella halmapala]
MSSAAPIQNGNGRTRRKTTNRNAPNATIGSPSAVAVTLVIATRASVAIGVKVTLVNAATHATIILANAAGVVTAILVNAVQNADNRSAIAGAVTTANVILVSAAANVGRRTAGAALPVILTLVVAVIHAMTTPADAAAIVTTIHANAAEAAANILVNVVVGVETRTDIAGVMTSG